MRRAEELLAHAARCDRLAEACADPTVAEKLRKLAEDYRQLSALRSEQASPSQISSAERAHGNARFGAPAEPSDRASPP